MLALLVLFANYRFFLPADYATSAKRYPVVYFFHGYGETYNTPSAEVGNYDPDLSSYAASHDVIIVKPDGSNPGTRRPYNECPVDLPRDCARDRDFVRAFLDLVAEIDSKYRTIPDREHRGVSGVSIGGWFAYFLAWKYPDRIGSASSFMGSPEFEIGGTEWSPIYQYRNYEATWTRLVIGKRDFIRWYHREMQKIWTQARGPHHEVEEFDATHGTPGMAKTLDFHMRAFANPLPKPAAWTHSDLYPEFTVWGYSVKSNKKEEGFITLEDVTPAGFRVISPVPVSVTTDKGKRFRVPAGEHEIGRVAPRAKPVLPDMPAGELAAEVADGRSLPLWKHAVERTTGTLGTGNGDGRADPGETIVFVLKDGEAYRGGEVLAAHSCLQPAGVLRDQWATYDHVGATQKSSVLRVTAKCRAEVTAYVRFLIPNAPEHYYKQGTVRLNVTRKK